MRGITIRHPWAHAVARAGKRIENRCPSSPCAHVAPVLGQRIAIHGGKGIDHDAPVWVFDLVTDSIRVGPAPAPPGAVVAVATVAGRGGDADELADILNALEIVDDATIQIEDWYAGDGAVGIVLRDVVAIPRPVPCRGQLGWWRVPADVEAEINRQLRIM